MYYSAIFSILWMLILSIFVLLLVEEFVWKLLMHVVCKLLITWSNDKNLSRYSFETPKLFCISIHFQAYLKFCCKVQGIRNELFASETCRVVALEEIKQHFPQGTTFEDYWPAKGSIEPVHAQRISAGNWTQRPATAAAPTPSVLPPAKPSIAPVMPQQQYNPMATVSTSRNAAVAAAAAAAAAAVNNMTAYDVNAFQQLLRSVVHIYYP